MTNLETYCTLLVPRGFILTYVVQVKGEAVVADFKTLADVVIQQMVTRDLSLMVRNVHSCPHIQLDYVVSCYERQCIWGGGQPV